jgi:branched-chain amino acid transport system substrate-binding protein
MQSANQIKPKVMKTKHNCWVLAIVILIMVFPVLNLRGQDDELMYGNTPKEVFPYNKFQKAYKYHFLTPTQFYGAGREEPAPKNLKEVRIGFLGPLEGSIIMPLGIQMLQGATLAIEEANKKGGYNGIPYKLMVHNDFGLWGAAANEVVKMDDEKVWAWIGTIDDINSHVAIRATLKMEILNVNVGDPDPTFVETAIPWVIRIISDDRQSGYVLADYMYIKMGHKRVAVIRANNRYGRVGVMEWSGVATRLSHPMIIEERFNDGETTFTKQLENIKKTSPDAILIWGNAKESALILRQIREMGMKQPVYGSDRMASQEFLRIAGNLAEGIVTTCQYNPDANNPRLKAFQSNYLKKFGEEPNVFAVHAYDGINLIIEAINKAGLNRVLIRDLMTDLKTFQGWEGISGKVVLDGAWGRISPIFIAKVSQGKFQFTPAPPMKKELKNTTKSVY